MGKLSTSNCRYALLTYALQREVEQGAYPIGTTLPTEAVLCERFNVSRCTVREALRQLRSLGLVASRQGSGTIVIANKPTDRFVQSLDSYEDLIDFLHHAPAEILIRDTKPLPEKLLKTCHLTNEKQFWLHFQMLRYWGTIEQPTLLCDSFIDAKYSAVNEHFDGSKTIGEIMGQLYGVKAAYVEQDIQAIALDIEQSRLLQCKSSAPALLTIRRCYHENGELLAISSNITPAERYTYSTKMRVASA